MKRLIELREDKDLSQKQIAYLLNITQSGYSKYERNEREIPIEILKKLCLFYGVSADYILELPKGLKYIDR